MKFIDLKLKFQNQPIIDTRNIANALGPLDRRRLFEWQKKGYIKKITNNFYLFTDNQINDTSLKIIANTVYSPSYIGLESAMSHYGLIPEAVYQVTSITSRKTKIFKTQIAEFSYRTIKKSCFWGYALAHDKTHAYYISDPEKTILDYFYLNPHQSDPDSIAELRLNKQICREMFKLKTFEKYLKIFQNKKLESTIAILKRDGYVKP